jgi:glycogen synthase
MEKIQILYVGKHKDILETVVRLINNHENWFGKGVDNIDEAKDDLNNTKYEIVLLGCGIESECEQELRSYIENRFPQVTIVQHYGGGSGLLSNEILEALNHASPLMN